ncbi:IscS subfamily cysteine desulfurase [Candidiatus Paracoxiella cheracis]|uniref:IscS subfamily cysteine desulfurase n=1 Tax=Candidiatus Paracoxiella cheracis TaxID=3405120 RepID=UPI003BF5A262
MKIPIFLDYMATTPTDPAVVESMIPCLKPNGMFGNPASQSHIYGWDAAQCVKKAREQVAALINADPREIIWTSGATESDNLAIKGAAHFYQRQGKHIIAMSTEHKAVLDTCAYLESQGFEVTYLNPQRNGRLKLEDLEKAIRSDTILVSIMHVNNETGVIQDIDAIGEMTRSHGILLHVDAAQSAGKVLIDLQQLKVDLMSFSGHKLYGPKGVGALYVRRNPRVRLEPLIHGGGHEHGMRSGTLPTHQIVGMGKAFELAKERMALDKKHVESLRKRLWAGISALEGVHLNGDQNHCIPGCLNVSFDGVVGESLMLSLRDIAISGGSACNSANPNPSHVLVAMGISREQANNSLRISMGRFTTTEEIDHTVAHITEQVTRLRNMSPIWQTVKEKVMDKAKKN